MSRIRTGFISGTIDDNPLVIGATTLTSTELANLPAIASPDVAVLILDPAGSAGAPEIVWVTAHTGSATTATISRGKEGSSARKHALNIPWICGPTTWDYGTKEFFVPVRNTNGVYTTVYGYTIIDSGEYAEFQFQIPWDFHEVEKVEILTWPDTTETVQWDVTNTWLKDTDNTFYTASMSNQTTGLVIGVAEAIDINIGSLYTSVEAGDVCLTRFSSDTNSLQVFGLRFKYH